MPRKNLETCIAGLLHEVSIRSSTAAFLPESYSHLLKMNGCCLGTAPVDPSAMPDSYERNLIASSDVATRATLGTGGFSRLVHWRRLNVVIDMHQAAFTSGGRPHTRSTALTGAVRMLASSSRCCWSTMALATR